MRYLLSLNILSQCCAAQLELQTLKNVDLTSPLATLLAAPVSFEAVNIDSLLPKVERRRNAQEREAIFKLMFVGTLYKNAPNVLETDQSKKQIYVSNLRTLVNFLLYGNYFSYSCSNVAGQVVQFLDEKEALKEVAPGSLRELLVKTLGDIKTPSDCPLRSAFEY